MVVFLMADSTDELSLHLECCCDVWSLKEGSSKFAMPPSAPIEMVLLEQKKSHMEALGAAKFRL